MEILLRSNKWHWGYRYRIVEITKDGEEEIDYFIEQRVWIFFWKNAGGGRFRSLEQSLNIIKAFKRHAKKPIKTFHYTN